MLWAQAIICLHNDFLEVICFNAPNCLPFYTTPVLYSYNGIHGSNSGLTWTYFTETNGPTVVVTMIYIHWCSSTKGVPVHFEKCTFILKSECKENRGIPNQVQEKSNNRIFAST